MKFKYALLTLALLALLSGPVLAQDEEEDVDAGAASAAALAERKAVSLFQQADMDKDKALSKEEFGHGKGMQGKSFEKYDSNGDGSMTMEEWKAVELKKD